MGNHALLGPSGASRWLACTPSARFEQRFPDTTSGAAKEGTVAHTLGELMIGLKAGLITQAEYDETFEAKVLSTKYYDGAMHEYCEQYCAFVLEQFYKLKAVTPDAQIFLEQHLDLQKYIPEGFGTGDVGIVSDGDLYGIDLKYGKGVKVEAQGNVQLKIYALGFYERFSFLYDIQRVKMFIYQPRMDNIASFEITVEELLDWAENYVKPLAEKAFKGEGDYVAGKHCKFCKGQVPCKSYAAEMQRIENLKTSNELSASEIAEILDKGTDYTSWIKNVQEYALREAIANNKHFPGHKLVEGRSNRVITDKDKCSSLLEQNGFKDYMKPAELKSLTELEKIVGKKMFNELFGEILSKPRGAPTLVPESDKRPVFNSAMLDFSEFVND